jgi:hypothetical protein
VRDEVLARLLALSDERARQEELAGRGEGGGTRRSRSRTTTGEGTDDRLELINEDTGRQGRQKD